MRTFWLVFIVALLQTACGGASNGPQPGDSSEAASPRSAASTRVYANGVFTDTDPSGTPAQVFRLYRAAFGRESDPDGLGFHIGDIETNGLTLTDISGNFIASPEFASRYGQLNTEQFVTQLYANVLHRAPDAGGLAFHTDNITSGRNTRAQVLIGFSESPENKANTAAAIAAGITFVPHPAVASRDCMAAPSTDAWGNMTLAVVHPIGMKAYACRTVVAADGHPVFEGTESLRMELRPGDCSGNSGFNDCANDRARMELYDPSQQPAQGKVITYQTRLYIPAGAPLRPHGHNILFLSQVNYNSPGFFGTLAYLEMLEDGSLGVRTHQGFTFNILNIYPALQSPAGQWIDYRVEVKASTDSSGYIKVYVNGALIVDEVRATLPDASANINFRVGPYNAYMSSAVEPFGTQVVYYDALQRSER